MPNPCLNCGACCASFRASFYWAECDDATPGGVPVELTEKLDAFRRAMRGTDQPNPRCIALEGVIGTGVFCAIYEKRASVCREFAPAWLNGQPNEGCDRARLGKGLAPLAPEIWKEPDDLPQVA